MARTNADRAENARLTFESFAERAGQDMDVEAMDVLVDLLTDAMHWCDEEGIDFAKAVERAEVHYLSEDGE